MDFLWEKPWFFNGKKHGFNGKTIYKWWIFHCHLWWNQRVNLPKTIDKTGHRLRLVGITHRETKELDDPSLFPCKFAIAIGAYPWTKAIQPSSHTVGHPVIFPWYSHEICYFSPKKRFPDRQRVRPRPGLVRMASEWRNKRNGTLGGAPLLMFVGFNSHEL